MAAVPAKEYKLLQAALLVQNVLDKPNALATHLLQPFERILAVGDQSFLKNFLASNDLKNILRLIDIITRLTQNPPKSPDGKAITNLHPLISQLRPERSEDRNCLISLNDAWNEIEGLLTKAPEKTNPEAQELYEILSDEFIRELLVAVDDTGNYRYTSYVDANSVTEVLYVEKEPAFVDEESNVSEVNDTLDQPFSMSTLPRDDQHFVIRQSSRDQRGKNHAENGELPSPELDFPHPPPRTSSISPRQRLSSSAGPSPRRVTNNNQYLAGSLGRHTSHRHTALPSYIESSLPEPGKLRTIHLTRRTSGEPLGITLALAESPSQPSPRRSGSFLSLLSKGKQKEENKEPPRIVIQRILVDSLADREGKLFPGDEIVEFNGMAVNSLDAIRSTMINSMASKVIQLVVKTPGIGQLKSHLLTRTRPEHKVYIRCLFKYDPTIDTLLPNTNLGVAFRSGDVLELVDSQDLNWWQVRRIDAPNSPVGLVPSQTLEERRQAFNQQAFRADTSKKTKKVKSLFRAADSSNLLVRSDLWVYEEVVPWPPSPVHTLLLIGPNGVGRRTLKFLLCTQYSQRFCFPISDTTDPKASLSLFRIRSKEDMESDIRQGTYVEWGTVDGQHYGISFAAIREIIASGRTALVDCQCQSVHLLHQPEFNPHVVFVSAPKFEIAKAMMDKGIQENLTMNKRTDDEIREIVEESKVFAVRNQHLYTHTLVNSDMAEGVEKLCRLVTRLEQQPGWIPAGWAYEMSLPKSFDKNGHGAYHLPGMSVISGSDIPGLPSDSQSVLGRRASSMLSTASPESAFRLARPPSVCSSLQLPELAAKRGGYGARTSENGRLRYEKRGGITRTETPLSPLSSNASPESEVNIRTVPGSTPQEPKVPPKTSAQPTEPTRQVLRAPSTNDSTGISKQQSRSPSKMKTSAPMKAFQGKGGAAKAEEDDDAISSTSSEED
ncbi:hypothetical protein Aperf_G00000075188 [Anoplocephala perfoliata]